MVNTMNDGRTCHVQVFKNYGNNTLYSYVNKMKGLGLEPHHRSDRLLKPAPHTTSPSWLYVLFSIAWIMVEDTVCRCSNKGKNTTYRNVNNMTGTGLEPKPPEWLVPETSALDHSAILPVYWMINSMNDGKTYHVQGFKIKLTILCIVMSTKWQE